MQSLGQRILLLILSIGSVYFLAGAFVDLPLARAQGRASAEEPPGEGIVDVAPTDCASPRNAVASLFYWTQPPHIDLVRASECFEQRGRRPGELQRVAGQLRSVFERRGLSIDPASFSPKTGWKNPATGESVVVVHPALPQMKVEKNNSGSWLWTKPSLDRAAYLAHAGSVIPESVLKKIPDSLRIDIFGVEGWQIISLLLVAVFGLVVRKIIQFVLRRRLAPVAQRLGAESASHIVDVFAGPGATLVMAGMLAAFYPQLELPFTLTVTFSLVTRAMVVLSLVLALYRLVEVAADHLSAKAADTDSKLDDQLVPLVRKALKVIVVIAGALFLLQNLSVNVGSLLAGLGIGGVAVALAAKDTIANFFGSIMIFIDRPFQIGDWVKIGDVEGIVEEVGFRSTRVRTFYNSRVTVPNAHFTEAAIDNLGMREYRRCFTTLNLTYDTTVEQMQAFVEGIRAIVLANESTRKDYYEIHFSGFGAHSLDVMVYLFFKVESWSEELRQRHNIFMEILRLARTLGVQFAFPTQTLHVNYLAQMGAERVVPTPKERNEMANVIRAFGPGGQLSKPDSPVITEGYIAGTTGGAGG